MSWIFLLTTHDKYQTRVLIMQITLGSYIFLSFTFPFYYQNPFDGSRPLLHIILVPYPLFSRLFWLQMVGTEVDLDYFHISLKKLVENISFFKKWSINNFIYWSPYVFLFLVIFLTSTFIVSWYSKVLFSSSIEIIMLSSS